MITFPAASAAASDRGVIPFVTQREGEEAAPANFMMLRSRIRGERRLFYVDEDPVRDRPYRDMLWARCSFVTDDSGMPAGEPVWKMLHPYRQVATMLAGRCQVCTRPARTPLGWIFLAGPRDHDPRAPLVWTNQPPVCLRHARTTAKLCPHMEEDPVVLLAQSAPLYGVLGSVYDEVRGVIDVVERPAEPVLVTDPRAPRTLASQLVRRLAAFRVLSLGDLLGELASAE